jgi:phospholipid-binding lipoprotein MlaA
VFGFNEGVDRWVLEPVATGWDWVLPERVQDGISNFFFNLDMPRVFLNDLLQGKPVAAGEDLGRFLVNSTVGIVGFIDVASRLDIPHNDEDFGQTLGRWGIPGGPYVVMPLLGPFTVRDVIAYPVDVFSRPHIYFVSTAVSAGAAVVEVTNTRADFLEEVRENRETALDYYVFIRNAYLQNRERRVNDASQPPPDREEDLYYLDEELEDEPEPDPGAGAPPETP